MRAGLKACLISSSFFVEEIFRGIILFFLSPHSGRYFFFACGGKYPLIASRPSCHLTALRGLLKILYIWSSASCNQIESKHITAWALYCFTALGYTVASLPIHTFPSIITNYQTFVFLYFRRNQSFPHNMNYI
jgi:hypothetical protein